MAVSSKMAKWMAKQVKETPEGMSKSSIKEEMDYIEMGRMPKKELEEIAKGRGRRADIADLELGRRFSNKAREKGGPLEGEEKEKAHSTTKYKEWRDRQDSNEMAKGGMAKKKPAAKKAPAKKTVAKKNTYNKYYGK